MNEQIEELPKVLVVDDRKENLVATRKVLKRIGAEIVEANSGNEALFKMLHTTFAVVLLDVQMPEMDGFEVASLMRQQEEIKNVPIIFVTAINKEEQYVDQAARIGAVDYVFKPINSNILKSKVKVFVDLFLHQKRLHQLNDVLVKNNDELERFAYICSHDLQEPIRIMGAFAELLEKNYSGVLDESGKKYLGYICKNAIHMQRMIHDILTFSRVGREEINFEKVDCNEVIEEIQKGFKTEIREKQAKVVFQKLPVIFTSKTLINLLFQNLVSNALKYQKGANPPRLEIEVKETEAAWLFSFSDNGIGINPEHYHKVFEMFQRIHRKEEYPGTGIGLCACKKFLELYGGKIWFESKVNEGAAFFFTVPKMKEMRNDG